jgi:hypothetical protein
MSTGTFVRRISSIFALTAALVALTTGPAWGAPDESAPTISGVLDAFSLALIVDDDLFSTADLMPTTSDPGTTHFGPFPSETTDSGTCGVDWATDHMNRFFTVKLVSVGMGGVNTYRVYEQFKDGTFTSFPTSEPSPGACDSSDGTPPGIINPDVIGTFHGYDLITVMSDTFHPDATCAYPCANTDVFLANAFGIAGPTTRNDTAFFDHYLAVDQSLVFHEWKNASCNRGGNHGDIASVADSAPFVVASCP